MSSGFGQVPPLTPNQSLNSPGDPEPQHPHGAHPFQGAPLGLVGNGRVGKHMAHYFDLLGLPYQQGFRSQPSDPSSAQLQSLKQVLEPCRVVFIAVSDPFIEEIAQALPDKTRFHFSGSLSTPHALGVHPLMTFGPELYSRKTYTTLSWIAESPEALRSWKASLPTLPNPCFSIQRDQKNRYHALCAMAGNFTAFLWAKLFHEFSASFSLPPESALPYLDQLCQNLAQDPRHAERFFTGPILRGDQKTLSKHLESLQGDPYQAVYQAFIQAQASGLLRSPESPLPANAPCTESV